MMGYILLTIAGSLLLGSFLFVMGLRLAFGTRAAGPGWFAQLRTTATSADKKTIRQLLLVAAGVSIIIFWTPFRNSLSTWLAASDGGKTVGLTENAANTWMWLALPVAAYIGYKVFLSHQKTVKLSHHVAPIDQFSVFVIVSVAGVLALGIGYIVVAAFGHEDTLESLLTGKPMSMETVYNDCIKAEELNGTHIPVEGKVITFCPEDITFFLHQPTGRSLDFAITSKFKNEHPEVLRMRDLSSFVKTEAPFTFPGSNLLSWRITINANEFRQSGLESIEVYVMPKVP